MATEAGSGLSWRMRPERRRKPARRNARHTPLRVISRIQRTEARIVRRVQRLGGGPSAVGATSRRASSPGACDSRSVNSARRARGAPR